MRAVIIAAVLIGAAGAAVAFNEGLRTEVGRFVNGASAAIKLPASAKQAAKGRDAGGRSVSVEAAPAKAETKTEDLRAIGSLQGDESIQLTTEIAGRIAEITFKEGQPVKQGDTLVQLDAALAAAEVTDAQARFEFAKSNLDRANALSKTGNVTEKAQDEAVSNFGIAESAVELARVRLSKHEIKAPFDGVIGVRSVSPGAYIGIGTPIANLTKLQPLKVDFKVPETYLSEVTAGQQIDVMADAIPDKSFKGEIYAIDPQVDVNGRALTVRARLPNEEGILRPGLFVRIIIRGKAEREVVTIPESALVPRGGDMFVFRIENGKAVETPVKVGERENGRVEILEGVPAETEIVTAGQQKLQDGSSVEISVAGDRPQTAKRRS